MPPIIETPDGRTATHPDEAENLSKAGYTQCLTPTCNYYVSPETYSRAEDTGESFQCPNCNSEYDLLHTPHYEWGTPGGMTRVGLTLREQGHLSEQLVYQEATRDPGWIERYGPLVWWQPGLASGAVQNALDGGTGHWGIEVKSVNSDNVDPRFVLGRDERESKHAAARSGTPVADGFAVAAEQAAEHYRYDNLLGVLVVLNFWKSVADIWVKEMPLSGWVNGQGRQRYGFVNFRAKPSESFRLLKEIPFKSPYLDPHNQEPQVQNPDLPF